MSSPPSQDVVLAGATHLTRQELLKRRLQHLRQLSRCYRRHYWALMDNFKIQYRNYYWKFGISPFKQNSVQDLADDDAPLTESPAADNNNVNVNNTNSNFGLNFKNSQHCSFVGCKFKAMALTRFCHLHILSDSKQKLYKACTYVIKRYLKLMPDNTSQSAISNIDISDTKIIGIHEVA
ncbi:INO80 complex subunit D-like isoform X2 [Hibiscus syriacus]|uniref:INO80 complex subunit D-like isoform X2 n=1 Tax=Hibiscus syriacus TaxID=106335 RepID=UPI001922DF30|nr:INO80 complex subunit D-like isoform X2 [Hibiscus syriacus]